MYISLKVDADALGCPSSEALPPTGSVSAAAAALLATLLATTAAAALARLQGAADVHVAARDGARRPVELPRLVLLEEHVVQQQHSRQQRQLLVLVQRRVLEREREQVGVRHDLLHRLREVLRLLLHNHTDVAVTAARAGRDRELLVAAHLRQPAEAAHRTLHSRERLRVRVAALHHVHRRREDPTAARLPRHADRRLRCLGVGPRHQRRLLLAEAQPRRALRATLERPVHHHQLLVRVRVEDIQLQLVAGVAAAAAEELGVLLHVQQLLSALLVEHVVLVRPLQAALDARAHAAHRVARSLKQADALLDRKLVCGADHLKRVARGSHAHAHLLHRHARRRRVRALLRRVATLLGVRARRRVGALNERLLHFLVVGRGER
eukprot:Rhum_TRINITY_DN15307_c9_g2::Rhum_TRINITY_DN15307_c9_g2_i7::g.151955::m.151955